MGWVCNAFSPFFYNHFEWISWAFVAIPTTKAIKWTTNPHFGAWVCCKKLKFVFALIFYHLSTLTQILGMFIVQHMQPCILKMHKHIGKSWTKQVHKCNTFSKDSVNDENSRCLCVNIFWMSSQSIIYICVSSLPMASYFSSFWICDRILV